MRIAAPALLGLCLSLGGGCGARSPLEGPEPCVEQGLERPCFDACGQGKQVCEAGQWQSCVVPDAERPCSNACGAGRQQCTAGVWSACQVPVASQRCDNACGSGVQECRDGAWQACEVPVATRGCSDDCGSGTESCVNGRWQRCEVPPLMIACESVCGKGFEICQNGSWRACNAPQPGPPKLTSTIRDFRESHPDFELPLFGDYRERGLVEDRLGADEKPVYAAGAGSSSTTGRENFDQWYRDTPGVNQSATIDLQLAPAPDAPGFFVYESRSFFPIDGQLFGNEGRPHNYHFTLEAKTVFDYIGGEVFSFTGDDDMWVFINHRLAIDLGGIHASLSASVDLDQERGRLGLVPGQRYPLHFFFAERHTTQSNFTIRTSIAESGSCP
jgi:fibro-slime domain-containing protein